MVGIGSDDRTQRNVADKMEKKKFGKTGKQYIKSAEADMKSEFRNDCEALSLLRSQCTMKANQSAVNKHTDAAASGKSNKSNYKWAPLTRVTQVVGAAGAVAGGPNAIISGANAGITLAHHGVAAAVAHRSLPDEAVPAPPTRLAIAASYTRRREAYAAYLVYLLDDIVDRQTELVKMGY